MADVEHLAILNLGVPAWNEWRSRNRSLLPDLAETDLSGRTLSGINFNATDLTGANLSDVTMVGAHLINASLLRANLGHATLCGSYLSGANASDAFLAQVDLRGAFLVEIDLRRATLTDADLNQVDLFGALLDDADLTNVDLSSADLSRAELPRAQLRRANLSDTKLVQTNLFMADLTGAKLTRARLVESDLQKVNLSNCEVYGASVWKVKLEGAIQVDLRITPSMEPVRRRISRDMTRRGILPTFAGDLSKMWTEHTRYVLARQIEGSNAMSFTAPVQEEPVSSPVTVDNIELAQFVSLLIDNKKIREVIDTVTSKIVLLIGRFSETRLKVLDAIRTEIRAYGYVPVLFDFDPSARRSLTETVLTLASIARFVIADLSEPRSVPQELTTIIPQLPSVPVQPIIVASQKPYGMFDHWRNFPSVLPEFRYLTAEHLIANLKSKVIDPPLKWQGYRVEVRSLKERLAALEEELEMVRHTDASS